MENEFRVMTSGAFTAAHMALIPEVERVAQAKVVTASTSIGTGETSLPNRLKRGEVVDIVIVAEPLYNQLLADGVVLSEGHALLARSGMAFAVRAGTPKPDLGTVDGLRQALLSAKSVGYSASESGKYFTGELVQRLGIADQVLPKSRLVGGGERVGTLISRGELEIGLQQLSELLPIQGIAHITPLPPEIQKISSFVASVAASCPDKTRARTVIGFLASPATTKTIASTGLEPMAGR